MSTPRQPGRYRTDDATEVLAVRFTGSTTAVLAIEAWMDGRPYQPAVIATRDWRTLTVPTPDGPRTAQPGDYVVKQADGTYSPVSYATFTATYQPVTEEEDDRA